MTGPALTPLGQRLYRSALELPLSDEMRVALFPERTFAILCAEAVTSPRLGMMMRAGLPLLWIALLVSMMVTAHVTLGIVATAALCWSFVVLVQAMAGAVLIASAPKRRVTRWRALDLWFAAHVPYSLWLIVPTVSSMLTGDFARGDVVLSAVVPLAWTIWIASGYCRTVLGTTRAGARMRLSVHQMCVWTIVVAYILFAGGLAGVTRYLARQFGVTL